LFRRRRGNGVRLQLIGRVRGLARSLKVPKVGIKAAEAVTVSRAVHMRDRRGSHRCAVPRWLGSGRGLNGRSGGIGCFWRRGSSGRRSRAARQIIVRGRHCIGRRCNKVAKVRIKIVAAVHSRCCSLGHGNLGSDL
jgi:hypothetical protein